MPELNARPLLVRGPDRRREHLPLPSSRYVPHQGSAERARRQRQLEAQAERLRAKLEAK
jgi:hypothetical protein